jgi:hypothetical protein
MSQYSHDITQKNLRFPDSVQQAYSRVIPTEILTERDTTLAGTVLVQIIDIYDIAISKYRKLEILEETDSSNTDRLRRTITNVTDPSDQIQPQNASLHKLVLQDSAGTLIYAIEYKKVAGLSEYSQLGCKLLLTNMKFQRGVALLEPDSVKVLGGSIPSMNVNRQQRRRDQLANDLKKMPGQVE